jgi:cupin fold WbuC family metalloprotein
MERLFVYKHYSRLTAGVVTHIHVSSIPLTAEDSANYLSTNEDGPKRIDLMSPDSSLQLALINMKEKETFIPHVHEEYLLKQQLRNTQETWVVIKGKIEASLFDLDTTPITKVLLNEGDALITLKGGHNYKCLSPESLVYEFKSGPYNEVLDKRRF